MAMAFMFFLPFVILIASIIIVIISNVIKHKTYIKTSTLFFCWFLAQGWAMCGGALITQHNMTHDIINAPTLNYPEQIENVNLESVDGLD